MQELGIRMIPAYSPQARGRMERSYGTWQGRLPQELRVRGITDVHKPMSFCGMSTLASSTKSSPRRRHRKERRLCGLHRRDLDWVFSVQQERMVNRDNTVVIGNRVLQLEKTRWKDTLAGQTVVVHEHLDGRVSIRYGPHLSLNMRAMDCRCHRRAGNTQRDCRAKRRPDALGTRSLIEAGGSASRPPGFNAFGQSCWIGSKQYGTCSRSPGPRPALELRPRMALSSA